MIDVAGRAPSAAECAQLRDPRVGGVILFARNYQDRDQLCALVAALRAVRSEPLLVAVDQEGGRVQRFREGFSALPAPACLGALHAREPALALRAARDVGVVMATELRRCDIDFSFAPVLDLDHGRSAVIGSRALARDPEVVSALAAALIEGMQAGGCAAVGKHFPGHGQVAADSHHELPCDTREFDAIAGDDLIPFARLAPQLQGIMPAHVQYPRCAPEPAGFSPFWLQQVLRGQLGFQGAIFSDDLSMGGALAGGGPVERARAAFAAGCDMALLCNDPEAAAALLAGLGQPDLPAGGATRLARLQGRGGDADGARAYALALDRLDALGLEGWRRAP